MTNIEHIHIISQKHIYNNRWKLHLKEPFKGRTYIYHKGKCEFTGSCILIQEKKYYHSCSTFDHDMKSMVKPYIIQTRIEKFNSEQYNKLKRGEQMTEEGMKFDDGKVRYDLIDSYALDELTKIYTFGSKKYADNNWRKGFKWGRIFGALMRHSWAFWRGEELDEESGLPHMAHAAWCCFTLMNFSKFKIGEDDRIIQEKENQ